MIANFQNPCHGSFYPWHQNPERGGVLLLGCGHRALEKSLCRDTHDNATTLDFHPEKKADICANVFEYIKVMKLPNCYKPEYLVLEDICSLDDEMLQCKETKDKVVDLIRDNGVLALVTCRNFTEIKDDRISYISDLKEKIIFHNLFKTDKFAIFLHDHASEIVRESKKLEGNDGLFIHSEFLLICENIETKTSEKEISEMDDGLFIYLAAIAHTIVSRDIPISQYYIKFRRCIGNPLPDIVRNILFHFSFIKKEHIFRKLSPPSDD